MVFRIRQITDVFSVWFVRRAWSRYGNNMLRQQVSCRGCATARRLRRQCAPKNCPAFPFWDCRIFRDRERLLSECLTPIWSQSHLTLQDLSIFMHSFASSCHLSGWKNIRMRRARRFVPMCSLPIMEKQTAKANRSGHCGHICQAKA